MVVCPLRTIVVAKNTEIVEVKSWMVTTILIIFHMIDEMETPQHQLQGPTDTGSQHIFPHKSSRDTQSQTI